MSAPEIPEELRDAALHGSYCPKMCNFACPVLAATGREATAPWALHRAVTAVAEDGRRPAEDAYRTLHGCTGCHACREACLYDLDVPAEVRAARRAVAAEGVPDVVAAVVEAVRAGRSPYDVSGSGADVAPGVADEQVDVNDAEGREGAGELVALVPGCADGTAEVEAASGLLAAAGRAVRVVWPRGCCGALLDDLGAVEAGDRARDDLTERIPATAVVLVGTDPHCLDVLGGLAGDRPVRHLSEELALAVEDERLDLSSDWTAREVTVHDPCVLARGHDVVTGPRRLLAGCGLTVVEPEGAGRDTVCAGAGMGFDLLDPDSAGAVAARRASTLPDLPTVTTCARARRRLADAGVDAVDLTTVLAGRLPGGPR